MNAVLKFCLIFWMIYGTEAQIARCYYRYQYHFTTGYKTTNDSYYSCLLDTRQANYNRKLTRIDGQHETGHSDADVKFIHNFFSQLKSISSIFCQKFPNLEVMKIINAEMNSIDEDSLSNCKNLNHLLLFGNKIRELPENLLIKNPKLTYLWINNNQLTTLPENFFFNQKKLEDLSLNENQINFLPSNIFSPLVKLEVLHLGNNKLQSINPEWFVNLHNLKVLGLKGNQISEIPSKCFASLKNLEKLWLNNNKLTTIYSDSFSFHHQLIDVDLQDNKINAIDPKFIDNTAVSTFNMTNNICSQSLSQNKAEVKNNLRNCFANHQSRSINLDKFQLIHIPKSCGRSVLPQGTIIGGTKIKRGSFPWIAALLGSNGQFFCGGTVVSNRKVLTAAHCIQDKGLSTPLSPDAVTVLLGFHNLSNSNDDGKTSYAVQSIQIHPDWSPYTTSYDADVAVLMLDQDVTFNEHIQPICMISTDSIIESMTEGYVVGNGKGGEDNDYENIPKILKMPIQTDRDCTTKDSTFATLLTGRTFCAGSGTGQGVCSGDSGSGFVVKIGNAFYLRGIVSASLAESILGCDVNSYSVFTDALKFTYWINRLSTAY